MPPTIELFAYKCDDDWLQQQVTQHRDGIGDGNNGKHGDAAGKEGHQISGYEADTDDTLNSREMKLFKPSKFVPKIASPSVWKPSKTTLS